jgi:hypothetical protein
MEPRTHAPAKGARPFVAGAVENARVTEREPVSRFAGLFGC